MSMFFLRSAMLVACLVSALKLAGCAQADERLSAFSRFSDSRSVEIDHSPWDRFLDKYVSTVDGNRTIVAYKDVSENDRAALQTYLSSLEATDPIALTKAQAYAYWVNFYNALTVEVILDNYPVKSIRRIGFLGPWKRKLATVGDTELSLDDMEKGILLANWDEPRTHYAVNCASYGCPNLQPQAFTAENTEMLLERGARDYVNNPRGISIDDDGDITASSIYKWYQDDFGGSEAAVLNHIRQHADEELQQRLQGKSDIRSYGYDWALNEQ